MILLRGPKGCCGDVVELSRARFLAGGAVANSLLGRDVVGRDVVGRDVTGREVGCAVGRCAAAL